MGRPRPNSKRFGRRWAGVIATARFGEAGGGPNQTGRCGPADALLFDSTWSFWRTPVSTLPKNPGGIGIGIGIQAVQIDTRRHAPSVFVGLLAGVEVTPVAAAVAMEVPGEVDLFLIGPSGDYDGRVGFPEWKAGFEFWTDHWP